MTVCYDAVSYGGWHGQTGQAGTAAVGIVVGRQDPAMTTLLIGFPLVAAVLMGLLGALPVGVVGGGTQVAATHTGSTVKRQSAWQGDIVGFSRPTG